ncbi:MAG: glycosyltransferase family 4 protein [Chloroflexi bacterium]|nr:glycosyltransferase family 4 protein [Chloroflexota bacterium]
MRFVFLTQYFSPEIGAAPVRLTAIARELIDLGHEVEVVTALPNYPSGKIFPKYRHRLAMQETMDGIHIHRVWLYAANGAGLKRLLNYMSFTIASFWGLLRNRRPDYLFVESPPLFLAIPGIMVARLWQVPMILNVADLWPDALSQIGILEDGLKLRLLEKLGGWAYCKCHLINTATEGIRQSLEKEKNVPSGKICLLPNGADTTLFKPMPYNTLLAQELGINEKKVILYAGTHSLVSGMSIILKTALLLQERSDIVFVLIGDGPIKAALKAEAAKLGLQNVLFLEASPPDYIAKLYSITTVALSTLIDSIVLEGTRPAKIFPAMASGVPTLYSGYGEGARLLEAAEGGIVIPPQDATALAQALVQLVDNPEICRQLGINARRYIEAHLSWKVIVEHWLEYLLNHDTIH